MDERRLKRAVRNGWILMLVLALLSLGLFYLTYRTNHPGERPRWDMGGAPFVPASSPHASGYYQPPHKEAQQ